MDVVMYKIDGVRYILINQVKYNDIKYVYLSSTDGNTKMINKIYENEKDMIYKLDDEEEFNFAIELFKKKWNS